MKRLFVCGLCLSLGILNTAKADAVADDTETLHNLAAAASIDEYGKYDVVLTALGFSYSGLRSRVITQSGTEPALVLGTRLDLDVSTTDRTALARGTKKVEYSNFVPHQNKIGRVILIIELDTNAVCISDDHFVAAFAPVSTVLATDTLRPHFEREFTGQNHRGIAAEFSAGCATRIVFTQMP